jgi:hypothetical protein
MLSGNGLLERFRVALYEFRLAPEGELVRNYQDIPRPYLFRVPPDAPSTREKYGLG